MPIPTRDRVLLAVFGLWVLACVFLAATSVFIVFGPHSSLTEQHKDTGIACENLQAWYDGFNEEYFLNQLPKNTKVDYGEPGYNVMAVTFRVEGRDYIILSKKLNLAPRVAHGSILHEMCHLKTRDTDRTLDGHGPEFQSCMLRLAEQRAFENIW